MKRIAVIVNRGKSGAIEQLQKLMEWAQARQLGVETDLPAPDGTGPSLETSQSPAYISQLRQKFSSCDLAVTLGGDGTLLYGVQVVAPLNIPVLAVNMGSLGFHTQVEPQNMLSCLDAVAGGEFRTESRLLLQAELISGQPAAEGPGSQTRIALNDIVISRSAWGRMVHLRLHINQRPATDLFADGLIVATPTGSSAYNYAAHGPALEPGLDAYVLNAICSHQLHFSPVVVSATTNLMIEFHPRKPLEEAHLLVDGQAWCSVSHEERLKISRAPMYLPLIVFEENFFDKLRDKLAWGGLS